jgi:zinc transporter ZupT
MVSARSERVAPSAGYLLLGAAAAALPATILAFAPGGVLAMLAKSMIPEAFADAWMSAARGCSMGIAPTSAGAVVAQRALWIGLVAPRA